MDDWKLMFALLLNQWAKDPPPGCGCLLFVLFSSLVLRLFSSLIYKAHMFVFDFFRGIFF